MNNIKKLKKEINDLKEAYFNLIGRLYRLSEVISFQFDTKKIFNTTAEILKEIHPECIAIGIFLKNDNFNLNYYNGSDKNKNILKQYLDEMLNWIIEEKKVSVLPSFDEKNKIINSIVFIPLLFQEEALGIIEFSSYANSEMYLKEDIELFTIIGYQIAVALQNSYLYSKMQHQNNELKELKNYLESILKNMVNPIIVIDNSGKIITFNLSAEKFFKTTEKEIKNKHYGHIFGKDTTKDITLAIKNACDLIKNQTIELNIKINNKNIPIESNITPLISSKNKINGYILVIRDLSQSKEIKRLKELDKIKSELISNVSHELKTPLTSIKAYTETLLTMLDDNIDLKTQQEFLKIINSESERLTKIIENLLLLSKTEANRLKLNIKRFNLTKLIKEIINFLSEICKKNSIKIEVKTDKNFIIKNDPEKIKQILLNLINNAIKYNKKNGKIRIRIDTDHNNIIIKIIDTGIGISKENLNKIFDRFFRVDSSLTYEISGTGLGLSICKDLVKLCNGSISVWSKKGIGSIFTIRLRKDLK